MSHSKNSTMPPPSRKVFNTFIDDGALISGVKRSMRDGIKRMIREGSINLFVPLHTLDRLRRLSKGNDHLARDAADALRWLDDITSTSDRVHLQGGFELYNRWEEVEQYLLPDTLLSMETESLSADSITDDLADVHLDTDKASLSSSGSVEQPSNKSSPISAYSTPSPATQGASQFQKEKALAPIGTGRPSHRKSPSEASGASSFTTKSKDDRIPFSLRPFFNHILWRIHHEQNADVALESFILITNDQLKQTIAQRFGIRAKSLDQLRKIVAREFKEYKNHLALQDKEAAITPAKLMRPNRPIDTPHQESQHDKTTYSDDEDEVVFKREPPKAPQAMAAGRKIVDPDQFGRPSKITNGNVDHRANAYPYVPSHRGGRGGRGHTGFRGRSGFRGNFVPQPRPHKPIHRPQAQVDPNAPMDPDSFERPAANGRLGARGGRRRLWEPS